MTFYRMYGKRALDLALSGTALAMLSPLMLLIALVVRVTLGKPVFFRQRRPGLHGKPFVLLKFRTMRAARDATGRPLPDSERLTRLGGLLRSSSMDELPELFNVLRGDMSLVGPRPLLMQYLSRYSSEQMRRHDVKPGITGWAQINGRNALNWEQKFELDLWYARNVSLVVDLKILAATVGQVIKGSGISSEGHATMPEFMGTTHGEGAL